MVELEVQSNMKTTELKDIVNEKMGNDKIKIRLFCVGQELEDKMSLSKYNIANNYTVICYRCK